MRSLYFFLYKIKPPFTSNILDTYNSIEFIAIQRQASGAVTVRVNDALTRMPFKLTVYDEGAAEGLRPRGPTVQTVLSGAECYISERYYKSNKTGLSVEC
jgi:hypothetical protein